MSERTGHERNAVDQPADQTRDDTEQTRRDAILRLGRYTAPAMLAMLLSDKAAALS